MRPALALVIMSACAFQSERPLAPTGRTESLPTTREDRAVKYWLTGFFQTFGTPAQACKKDSDCQKGHVCSTNIGGDNFCYISCKRSPCPEGLECAGIGSHIRGHVQDICINLSDSMKAARDRDMARRKQKRLSIDELFQEAFGPEDEVPSDNEHRIDKIN